MNDHQVGVAMTAVMGIADSMRADESEGLKLDKAQKVLDACAGNALTAICLMAAVVPPEDEIDVWWQAPKPSVSARRLIEQGIARGDRIERVLTATGCSRAQYQQVLARMNRAVSE